VKKYQFEGKDLLIITFDDKVITLDKIISKLEKDGSKMKGKPVYINKN